MPLFSKSFFESTIKSSTLALITSKLIIFLLTTNCNRRHIMARNIKLIVYPVKDIEKAKAFYGKFLAVEPYVEGPYYVGYRVDDQEVGLDPNSKIGPIAYTDVTDIKSSLQSMVKVGAEIVQDVKEVGGGLLIAQVKDVDGNVVGLRQQS
jgi:predicted enzyme related to lactoylglutathione lyase